MKKNQVLIFPTDTVYGMGTTLWDNLALQRIYALKQRCWQKPLPILFSCWSQVALWVEINVAMKQLMKSFWPGPLTIILRTSSWYQQQFGVLTVGLRCPNHPSTLELLRKTGPLRTTSCNLSGHPPLNDFSQIYDLYAVQVDDIYRDYTELTGRTSLASTIVDCSNFPDIQILRVGAILPSAIFTVYK